MLRMVVGQGCSPSAEILSGLLAERGVPIHRPGTGYALKTLCWGAPIGDPAALNGALRGDKLDELRALETGGVPIPKYKDSLVDEDFAEHPLWYARKLNHKGGTDLRAVTQADEAAWRKQAGWAFFTARVPIRRELRTWVFRGRHLGTYEKKMVRPEEYTGLGRNNRYGFAFSRLQDACDTSVSAHAVADRALTALGLDFGAVDLIQKPGDDIVALEVNTAPGIENERRLSAIKLADCIVEWYRAN